MSILSCLHPEFIKYLYHNDLKIFSHENKCNTTGIIRGGFGFLLKKIMLAYL